MQIYVKKMTGKKIYTLDVAPLDSIEAVKQVRRTPRTPV